MELTAPEVAVGIALSVLSAVGGWYLAFRKQRQQETAEDRAVQEQQETRRRNEQRRAERTARDEYRDLFNEVKLELIESRTAHTQCERRCARLEAALQAAGIPIPPYSDAGSGVHPPVPGGDS